jgi:hypothetical protein
VKDLDKIVLSKQILAVDNLSTVLHLNSVINVARTIRFGIITIQVACLESNSVSYIRNASSKRPQFPETGIDAICEAASRPLVDLFAVLLVAKVF